ncbi:MULTISPECIES: hypothetical protein [Anaeromyxobacter]|uniref:hypothetical protein n=1 Tax=Anaeromyxobacter TaxID=161492 RepID=UPI001F566A1F|nr:MULTISPECIES: hypothetical protein [unclassified Anaeromyxobacter]
MEPEIRAALLKLYLEQLRTFGDGDAASIRGDVRTETVRRVEEAPAAGWLPIAFEVEIVQAVQRRRGDDGVRELGRALGRVATETPVLRPLVTATLAMLGRRPEVLAWIAAKGWNVATRNAGHATYLRRGPGLVHVVLEDLPPVSRDRAHLLRSCGGIEGLYAWAGRAARVDLVWEPGTDRAIFVSSWG